MLNPLYKLAHTIFSLQGRNCYYAQFVDKENKAWRGHAPLPELPKKWESWTQPTFLCSQDCKFMHWCYTAFHQPRNVKYI